MMESFEKNDEVYEEMDSKFRQEIYSKAVRAGKRTYFFDVKSTRKEEYYLTITESKKQYEEDGKFHFEKHKIFLYKEDFEKFADGLNEVVDFILRRQPMEEFELNGYQTRESVEEQAETGSIDIDGKLEMEDEEMVKNYTDVEFEDLNK